MSLASDENHLSLPTENLRRYISDAVLPDFPAAFPMASGSRNGRRYDLLSTEPDFHRKLKKMTCLGNIWQARVAKFCEVEIPSSPISKPKSTGSTKQCPRITIPSPSFRVERFGWPPNLDEVESVNDATRAVLCTAERIISLLWPRRSEGFKFTDTPSSVLAPLSHPDLAIAAYSFYGRYGDDEASCLYDERTGIAVVSMPCWALGDNEMKEFTQCRTVGNFLRKLPPFQDPMVPGQEPPSFDKYQKIWAKLWDLCATRLGRAKCSQVIGRRNQFESGSVLKWVVFWLAAALNVRGTWLFSRDQAIFGVQSLSSEIPDVCDKDRMAPPEMHKVYTDPSGKFLEDVEWLKRIKRINTVEKDLTFKLQDHSEIWFTKFTS
ncbi:hypothetical protein BU17DRAFT_69029 [Hysterangium stoloniferum]|nr:hypothetical protein BU17DRAFT_69029 [Hysterangium stoloniferum]